MQTSFRRGEIDLRRVPAQDRACAWRRAAAPNFEVSGLPGAFLATGRLMQFGAVVFTDSSHPAQVFTRDAARIRRDGADHISLSVEFAAGNLVRTDGRDLALAPGGVTLFDLARPVTKVGSAGRTLCLHIERDALEAVLPGAALNGADLGPAGALFAEHVRLLARAVDQVGPESAAHLERATLEMLAACLRPSLAGLERAAQPLEAVRLSRAGRVVEARMHDPDFGPAELGRALGMSRSRLYLMLEPFGGVAAFIRDRRLEAARRLLAVAWPPRQVQEVAFAVGFRSDTQFSRAFRRRYGLSPGEARQLAAADAASR